MQLKVNVYLVDYSYSRKSRNPFNYHKWRQPIDANYRKKQMCPIKSLRTLSMMFRYCTKKTKMITAIIYNRDLFQ